MKASAVFALIPFLALSAALPITEVVSETLNKTLQARYSRLAFLVIRDSLIISDPQIDGKISVSAST